MRVGLKLNILIVMQFSGEGGGYMEQDKAHPPPLPVNHGQVYKLV